MPNSTYYIYGPVQTIAPPSKMTIYGAVPLEEEGSGAPKKDGLVHLSLHPSGRIRARVDPFQVFLTMVLPVIIFAIVAALMSFKLHYNLCVLAWFLALCCVLPGLYAGWIGKKAFDEGYNVQGKWMMILCCSCLFTWLLGLILGSMNYYTNSLPFYEMSGLNYYASVDPSMSGQSHIDAGRILFQPGSRVALDKAMGVKITGTYCVAPVVMPGHTAGAEYDYWAVGSGCCSSVQPENHWTCGEIDNPYARAGMRVMSDAARPFYRMAVQEAEATYGIQAKHPIFIHWMQDPAATMDSWHTAATRTYTEQVFAFLVFMFFVSCSAAIYFSRGNTDSISCQGTGFQNYMKENSDIDFGVDDEGSFTSVTL